MPEMTLDDLTRVISRASSGLKPEYKVRQVYLSPEDYARFFAEFRARVPRIEGLHERDLFIVQGVTISRRRGYVPGEVGLRFAPNTRPGERDG